VTLEQRTFAQVEVARARRADPETSKVAAARSHDLSHEHFAKILQVVRRGGDWTAHEIGLQCGLTSVQVTRRFAELVAAGEIAEVKLEDGTTKTRPGGTGRPMRCFDVPCLRGPRPRPVISFERGDDGLPSRMFIGFREPQP